MIHNETFLNLKHRCVSMKHWWTISMVNVPEFTVALFFYLAPHSIQSGVFKCTKHVKMDVLSEDGCPQSSVCSEAGLLWKSKSEVFSFWTEDAENRKCSFRSMLRKKHTNSIRTYRYYCYDTSWESNRWFICCKAREPTSFPLCCCIWISSSHLLVITVLCDCVPLNWFHALQ